MPDHCDGCGAAFSIYHALDSNKGDFITALHNNLCDGITKLPSKALTPTKVCANTKLNTGCSLQGEGNKLKGSPSKEEEETKGVLLSETSVRIGWAVFTTCVG